MSDWTSSITSGWSLWIIALAVINVLGCVWLLWSNSKRRPGDPAPDETSHVWDGDLTEYNKPMPKWWINLFWLTILFSIGYLIWYPGFGAFAGTSKWTSVGEMKAEQKVENAKLEAAFKDFHGKPIDQLAQDPKAVGIGRGIFNNTCATCHGSTAQGAPGYPNLTDKVWKWGGTPDDVLTSIQKGRVGVMTPWGDALRNSGGPQAVDNVMAYVRAMSQPGVSIQNDFMASQGKKLYDGVCVACHGVDGKGNTTLGAPDLTDNDWLYGSSDAALRTTIEHGRQGVMPPHGELLGDTRSRLVGAYVWSLSHKPGEVAAASAAAAPAAAPAAPAAAMDPARDAKVYFETGSSALSAGDKKALGVLAETMKASPDVKAAISGYHDATGNAASNAELAKQRAIAVRDVLIADGVKEDRIGMEKPVETTGDGDPKEARRVEVHVK